MIRYNPKGLTTPQIDESRRRHGDNVITPPKDDSAWRLLLEKFRDPIIRILLLAAVLSLIIGFVHKDFTESVGIICAIILATCVGFWFEWDAQRRFRRLNQVNDDIPVKVMREGSIREIPRRDVVTGDVVYIESGETIPADGELVEAVSLKINESTLTGEPEVDKTVNEADFDPEATYPSNAVLRGTTVADGYGVMVVTAVGDATEAGRVTEQSTVQSEEQTPLDRQLTRLSRLIGRLGILLSALIFCVMLGKAIFAGGLLESDWLTISQHVLQIFMVSVAIIVMAVPEGLPMSITLSLAMSMRRMLKTNNLVRKMHACETMGAVTVICTDKTGTLTQNLLHDNCPPEGTPKAEGAMMSQDIFIEVGHGPTLIDNNIMLSPVSVRMATDGIACVHNLMLGSLTAVGGGTGDRYTPYHIRHRTEVAGFMTFLHGDDRFYNNIFIQNYPVEETETVEDMGFKMEDNQEVGTHVFDEYPTYDEWISHFELDKPADMSKLEPYHNKCHLPVWVNGNAYFNGAKACVNEKENLMDNENQVKVELVEKDGHYSIKTNVYEFLKDFRTGIINSDILGYAFEPEQRFEDPDGSTIIFDQDYLGEHRGVAAMPGPFADGAEAEKILW